jgi:hypothetical protein
VELNRPVARRLVAAAVFSWLPAIIFFVVKNFGDIDIGGLFALILLGCISAPVVAILGYKKSQNKKRALVVLAITIAGTLCSIARFVNG